MVTITLPPELEQTITEQALRNGITPELLSLDALFRQFLPSNAPPANEGTLADFLGDFIGCLDSGELVPGGARMSENISEKFAEGVTEKREELQEGEVQQPKRAQLTAEESLERMEAFPERKDKIVAAVRHHK